MQRTQLLDIGEIAEKAQTGEDISEHFTQRYVAKQNITLDLPLALLRLIDAECQRLGITRQLWIRMACEERLHKIPVNGDTRALVLPTAAVVQPGT